MYASILTRISALPMASKPKPHLLHQLAGTALQSSAKRARTMNTESSSTTMTMKDAFANYADYLNHFTVASERFFCCSDSVVDNSGAGMVKFHVGGVGIVMWGVMLMGKGWVSRWMLVVYVDDELYKLGPAISLCHPAKEENVPRELPGGLNNSELEQRKLTFQPSEPQEYKLPPEFCRELVGGKIINDKRERVIKASRDITSNSKKVIFQVHRISRHNKEAVLEKAEKDLAAVTDQYISQLVKELQGTDLWKLRRAYSPGVQEYVEAATFCKFCRTGTLLNLEEINATLLPLNNPSLEPLQVNVLDYLLGLADLTGELMRLAIGRISDGEFEFAEKICRFVRDIYRELTLLFPLMDDSSDMKMKMDTMLQSVVKIENACFRVHVRGSEYTQLGSSDPSSFLLGLPDS
ncbi:hypothetical protein JRO89_XS05G0022700 [Xanthoceras sorbifolium]|uniref:Translin-associated protein X n=1 Tax=Xanthoceras sorbifolium TaxID=99658 RepID=A0ABQ8I027_9ROSI|nr:hypothetical protein JRO89_XS05G0022700 [Xanthoceras sorbifolium]